MTPSKKIKTTVNTRLAPFANLVELQFFYRIFVQPKILVFVSRKRRKARERQAVKKPFFHLNFPNALIYTIVSAELHSVPTNEGR